MILFCTFESYYNFGKIFEEDNPSYTYFEIVDHYNPGEERYYLWGYANFPKE